MNIVLCNSCLSTALNDQSGYGVSVLHQIINKRNPFKMILDKNGHIGASYEDVIINEDDDDYLQTILKMIEETNQYKIVDVHHQHTSNCHVNTLINSPFDNILFTTDPTRLINDHKLLVDHRIQVKSEDESESFINGSSNYIKPPLLKAIIKQLTELMGDKLVAKLEDWHTADLRRGLTTLDFEVQNTSKGVSEGGIQQGELDLYVSENGNPVSVIEALKESSCGEENTNISSHLNKLINFYDCWGLPENFLITYYEGANLDSFWKKYISYMKKINERDEFSNAIPQLDFIDISEKVCEYSDIKVAKGIYQRSGRDVLVYHIVCNVRVPKNK